MADKVRRTVPQALRRGLTFWRRSIQARVVVSTVLLSTVVLVAVGWFLLRQVEQGLVNHRVSTVVREVGTENKAANDRLAAIPFSDTDAVRQAGELASAIFTSGQARGFSVVIAGPGSRTTPLADRGTTQTPQLDLASVPQSLIDHFDTSSTPAWTYTTIQSRSSGQKGKVLSSTPGIVVGLDGEDPGRPFDPDGLLPVPARRRPAEPGPGHPCAADRRRPAPGADRGAHLPAHAADRHPDPDGPAGGRTAGGRAAAGAAPGHR